MPNILINPSSGILEFNTGIAGGSVFDSSLSGAARLTFNSGEINLVSYSTGVTDRFTVDGAAGRLFSVSDALTGSIFSVNDIAGLPLIEVVSTTGDTITIGPYNTNTLVVKDTRVGIGTGNPSYLLDVNGSGSFRSGISATGGISNIGRYTINANNFTCNTVAYFGAYGSDGALTLYTDTARVSKVQTNTIFPYTDSTDFKITNNSNVTRLFINSGGNVGIGTGNPSYLLDVDGTGFFRGPLYSSGIVGVYASYTNDSNYVRGTITSTTSSIKLSAEGTGSGSSGNTDISLIPKANGRIYLGGNGSYGGLIVDSSAAIKKILREDGAVAILEVVPNGNPVAFPYGLAVGSYVGNNPSTIPILVKDSNHVLAQLNTTNPQTYRIYNTYTDTGNFERGKIGWNSNVLEIGTEKGTTGGLPRNLSLITSGQPRLTIASDGNVGIGTSTPSGKLQVVGSTFMDSLYANYIESPTLYSDYFVNNNGVGARLFANISNVLITDSNLDYGLVFYTGTSPFQFKLIGPSGFIDLAAGSINYFNTISGQNIYKNGYSVLTTNDTGSFAVDTSKVVFTTGNQTIAGEKTFSSTIKSSNTSSIFQANGGNLSGNLEIIKIGNYYSFRLGQTGSWDEEYGNSTQLTLGNGLNGDGSNPGFTLYDFSNGGTFQVGSLISYGPYNGSTIRMGSDGIALWGNDGGDITISNGGVGINTNGSTPFYSLDVAGSIKGNEYFSSAGNSGITTSITVYDQNALMNKTLNFENGLLISIT